MGERVRPNLKNGLFFVIVFLHCVMIGWTGMNLWLTRDLFNVWMLLIWSSSLKYHFKKDYTKLGNKESGRR